MNTEQDQLDSIIACISYNRASPLEIRVAIRTLLLSLKESDRAEYLHPRYAVLAKAKAEFDRDPVGRDRLQEKWCLVVQK